MKKATRTTGADTGLSRRRRHAVAWVVATASLAVGPGAEAQTVPTGYQEYFVIGREQHVWDMLYRVATSEGAGSFDNSGTYWNGMNSVVSATASADNQVIYYDHWEDGYEADLLNPVQATTMVIGDGNAANGRACDFTTDPRILPCGGATEDTLFQGSFVNFNSDQGLPGVTPNPNPGGFCQSGLPAPPLDQRCSVPVNPRNPADIRFDGGDRIMTSGGPLSVLHPQDPLSPYIGGATEIISLQAVAAAQSYSIPVGEDSYGGNGSVTEPFKYVDLDLVAFQDGTQVFIDSPGAGTVSFTLNQGQHYSSRGLIDDTIAAPAITINEGTKVSTTGPITGMIFTGGDGTFAVRMYTLLPDLLHSTDYVITAPGDNPGMQGSRPLNLYILNPDPLTAINVTVTDSLGTNVINIPANSMVDYNTGTGRFVPSGSTVRLTSDRNFWGVSGYDHSTPANDWGHSWLASRFLTETYTVSFAPGVNNPAAQSVPPTRPGACGDPQGAGTLPPGGPGTCNSINRSPVFVSATLSNTQVKFDLDNDGLFDLVDNDSDDCPDQGTASDATCALIPVSYNGFCGLVGGVPGNCIYTVNALQSLRAYDFVDYDNSGTRIVANKPVGVAYGQDTDQATGPDPIQDTGYTIYPINQDFLDPVLVIDKQVDVTTVPTAGGVATYTLTVTSYDFGPLTNLRVFDLLDPAVPGGSYVPGSTLVTYPNLLQDTTDPTITINPGGRDQLEWTLSPASLGTNRTLTVRYSVNIPPAPGGTPRLLTNEGHAEGRLGGSIFSPFDTADLVQTDIALTKSVDSVSPAAGDVLTFTLNVVNGGAVAETGAVISDAIPAHTTFVPGSITDSGPFAGTGTFDAAQNAVVWTAANFPPGGPHTLTFQARVNPGVPAGTPIENRGGYESNQTPYFLSNEVMPVVVGPLLQATKTGPAGPLHPGQAATFEILVENLGAAPATAVRVIDPFPSNATYTLESMEWRLNAGAFTPVTDAADADEGTLFVDRVELLAPALGAGEDLLFRFSVVVDPGTAWRSVNNQATVTSTEILPFDTNLVSIPIVGDAAVTGRVFLDLDGDGVLDPGEPGIPNVDVVVTDATGVSLVVETDANGDYVCTVDVGCYRDTMTSVAYGGSDGTRDWSANPWTEFRAGVPDQDPTTGSLTVVPDPLGVNGFSLEISGGGQTPKGFDRFAVVGGSTTATLSYDYRRFSLDGGDQVTVAVSYNGGAFVTVATYGPGTDGAWQNASFTLNPGFAINDVVVRFGTTAGFGGFDFFYVDNVILCPSNPATIDVDETDPNFPVGVTNTTPPEPRTVVAVSGTTAVAAPIGYVPPPITVDKRSSAAGSNVAPGETITYTIEITNNTGVTQTGLDLTDPLPAGTSYVAGSAQVSSPVFRVSEYYVSPGSFTGVTYDLTLSQDLVADYFVLVQGSDGDGTGTGGGRDPDENYARLTRDPFGTGDLIASGATNQIRLERGGSVGGTSWVGVVTVVECLADCDAAGFRLRSVEGVVHGGATLSGTDTSATAWTALGQVQLVGGFNGAGCSTGDTDIEDQKVCHARIYPSGTNTINWTRDAGGTLSMSAATSTVMVVEWGSEWTVQRDRVQGTNGGDSLNAVGEYNTAALGAAVARDNTWVWGTGHTDDNGIGDSGEGVVVTLGDGVNQNASESTVAAGTEYGGTAIDFEVYALTHADLATDYRFKADGDTGALTLSVPVDSAAPGQRMALVTNGQNGTGTAYPRPMLSARYTSDTNVELRRRRSGQPFPAWVQGIDFSAIAGTVLLPDPPDLIDATDGYTLAPGETLTVTFQVVVDEPLAPGITDIVNTATVVTDQEGPISESATDPVVRPAVVVEYNNADFTTAGTTISYTHEVLNTGDVDDAYWLTLTSEQGWTVDLLDPDTGGVIARDTNGDGVWDAGVTINTGTLAPGERVEYRVRITVPGGTPAGTQDHTRLQAVSSRLASVGDTAEDETTVLGLTDFGPVALVPDNSGVVVAGGSEAYTHRVINRTGASDTFNLYASSSQGWTATIYNDSNGDGVYSPGIDVAINNTLLLADSATQLVFVVVDAPVGTPVGTVDVTHLSAVSRADPTLFDGATDTTTVVVTGLDLSGGGTRIVQAGSTGTFPGTLVNLDSGPETYDLDLTMASLYGLDGLNHSTELLIDTDADGIPDTSIAVDSDGDGTWDTIQAGYDTNGDNEPDVTVPGGETLAYELRRAVDPAQTIHRDYVTLTAISSTGGMDSITSTNLLAAVTRATLRGLRVDPAGIVEFATGSQRGTRGFHVYDLGRRGLHQRLNRRLIRSPRPTTLSPVLYRLETRPIRRDRIVIVEVETSGKRNAMGPFSVGDVDLARALEEVRLQLDRAGVPDGAVRMAPSQRLVQASGRKPAGRRARASARRARRRARATQGVKLEVDGTGWVSVSLAELRAAGLQGPRGRLRVSNLGEGVPASITIDSLGQWVLGFHAWAHSTDYAEHNVYVVSAGRPAPLRVPLTRSSAPARRGFVRIEQNWVYLTDVPLDADPWLWDWLIPGEPWPYDWWDPTLGTFALPDLPAQVPETVPVQVRLLGYSQHEHTIEATLNGVLLGQVTFAGRGVALLEGSVPGSVLQAQDNKLTLSYDATPLPGTDEGEWAAAYLDDLELGLPAAPRVAPIASVLPYAAALPELKGAEYLIVTHGLFLEEAHRLAELKRQEGLEAVVVDVERAYDRFSGGFVEPNAVQALIRHAARRSGRLRFVVLFGDDTFDPRDFVGMGAVSYVPSLLVWEKDSGRVPSENPYADFDGDARPEVAIGRLPVQTVEQARAVVDKIADQQEVLARAVGRHLFAVDNSGDADLPFREEADAVAVRLPAGSAVAFADVAEGIVSARETLDAAWNVGAQMTHYFGHGGPEIWADEHLLSTNDLAVRLAASQPTVLLAWSCQTQWYRNLWGPAINEALFLLPEGGALASFGPTGITPPAGHKPLFERFYARVLAGEEVTLGEAIRDAKRQALDDEPGTLSAVEGFSLFGDPALRLSTNPSP